MRVTAPTRPCDGVVVLPRPVERVEPEIRAARHRDRIGAAEQARRGDAAHRCRRQRHGRRQAAADEMTRQPADAGAGAAADWPNSRFDCASKWLRTTGFGCELSGGDDEREMVLLIERLQRRRARVQRPRRVRQRERGAGARRRHARVACGSLRSRRGMGSLAPGGSRLRPSIAPRRKTTTSVSFVAVAGIRSAAARSTPVRGCRRHRRRRRRSSS